MRWGFFSRWYICQFQLRPVSPGWPRALAIFCLRWHIPRGGDSWAVKSPAEGTKKVANAPSSIDTFHFSSIAQSSSPILSLLSLGQGFAKSYSLTLLCKGFQSHQNVNFTAFTGKPVNKAVLFRSTSCWVVVFDLKTTRTPCCCWEWRSCFCKKKGKISTIRNKDRLEYIFFLGDNRSSATRGR